uniref:Uncharacterized protein n=1 Tax=Desulfovibrio desulfuricans (strain ATCC 27774 / DSM 6949 / MB) TaxID=525146 RepID=B8J311_DESDA
MLVYELEDAIYETEGIQIIIRANRNEETELDYDYQRACSGNTTLSELRRGRLSDLGERYEYEVIDGDNDTPNGRTKLSTIRDSY